MRERMPYYERIKAKIEEKTDISKIFQLIYHTSLLVGTILSIFYFTFIVEVMPRFSSATDLVAYLIVIFGSALILSVVLSLLAILPSLILNTTSPTEEQKRSFPKVFLFSYAAIQIGIIALACFIQYELPCIVLIILGLVILLVAICFKKFREKFRDMISLVRLKKYLVFAYPIIISSIVQIPLILIAIISLYDNTKSFESSILLYSLISIFIGIILILLNKIFLDSVNLDDLQSSKQSFKYLVFILLAVSFFISIGYLVAKKPNPIIIFPFQKLKLGYYEAELHFKKEFIEKSDLFDFNSTDTFFILSSVGDEYVLQKDTPGKNGNNKTNKIYRIKKDNVETEIIGNLDGNNID